MVRFKGRYDEALRPENGRAHNYPREDYGDYVFDERAAQGLRLAYDDERGCWRNNCY